MENYSYPTYPDSGESSPRSREIDFENPPPWDDQQQPNYKPKFMCSYGGKIQPRTHDNQLSYVGGDTKILAVDRNIKFPSFLSKLSSLSDCPPDQLNFKYQLPGEELDALISVTNDDDLDHMMHEYDRLYRPSSRPARMRLFLFSTPPPPPPPPSDHRQQLTSPPLQPPANVDYLFGLDKGAAVPPPPPPPAAVKFHDPAPEPVAPVLEYQQRGAAVVNPPDRVVGSDPNLNHPLGVQRQLQQMQIAAENDQAAYRRKSEDNLAGNYSGGDYYVQKMPEKFPSSNFPGNAPHQVGYWPEKHVSGEVYPPTASNAPGGGEQPVYMIPAPGTFYHAPMMRPPAPPATQGYYTVQRMHSEGYRDAPVYGGVPPAKAAFSSGAPSNLAPAQPVKGAAYTEGFGVVRPPGIPDNTGAAYAQVAYDNVSGRQVYYTAPGGVVHAPPYQGIAPAGMAPAVMSDVRTAGVSLGQDGKVINKVSQGPV